MFYKQVTSASTPAGSGHQQAMNQDADRKARPQEAREKEACTERDRWKGFGKVTERHVLGLW